MTPNHPPGPRRTLGNMREVGMQHLIAYCIAPARYMGSIHKKSLDQAPRLSFAPDEGHGRAEFSNLHRRADRHHAAGIGRHGT